LSRINIDRGFCHSIFQYIFFFFYSELSNYYEIFI
jgi:hypothetical protein